MKILGIETSCDETSCAVVEDGYKVLSNVIYSQVETHAKTGGVVPEVAAREHILKVTPVLEECLSKAKISLDDIDAIAITKGPGLISSLIIGTEAASVISYLKNKILIPVHHIAGHIYANFLNKETGSDELKTNSGEPKSDSSKPKSDSDKPKIDFPILVLTVSGGHNEILLMTDHNEFKILGETRDDAAGEAFDKVARILGLGYPGGPVISKAAVNGNKTAFKFPRAFLESGSLDFSFSGLKTAVLTEVKEYIKDNFPEEELNNYEAISAKIPAQMKSDLAASFQEAVVDVLTEKLLQAYLTLKDSGVHVKQLHLAGGVSANTRLREILLEKVEKLKKENGMSDTEICYPKNLVFCTDNAAMIASAGYYIYKKNPSQFKAPSNITPTTSFDLF